MTKENLTKAEITTLLGLVKEDDTTPANRGAFEEARVAIQDIMDRMANEWVDPNNQEKGKKGANGVPNEILDLNNMIITCFTRVTEAVQRSRGKVRQLR